jgi:hypothetical protein
MHKKNSKENFLLIKFNKIEKNIFFSEIIFFHLNLIFKKNS